MVLSEGPCLVGEDILNLPKVFIDVESSALEGCVRGSIVHVTVPVNEIDLDELDYFNGNIQGDWDNDLNVGWGGILIGSSIQILYTHWIL